MLVMTVSFVVVVVVVAAVVVVLVVVCAARSSSTPMSLVMTVTPLDTAPNLCAGGPLARRAIRFPATRLGAGARRLHEAAPRLRIASAAWLHAL